MFHLDHLHHELLLRLGQRTDALHVARQHLRLATLHEIAKPGFFEALASRTQTLVAGLTAAAREAGVPFVGDSEGGMFGSFFSDRLPQNYSVVMATDKERFNRFFHAMLDRGVYFAPALYEAGFVSSAHSQAEVDATVAAAREAFAAL